MSPLVGILVALLAARAPEGDASVRPELVLLSVEDALRSEASPDLAQVIAVGRGPLAPVLAARVRAGLDDVGRRMALAVLGAVGTEDDLDLVVEASGIGPEGGGMTALQETVAAILARRPAARDRVGWLALRAHADRAPALVRALATSGAEAQEELSAMLGRARPLDLVVLSSLVGSLRTHGVVAERSGLSFAVRGCLRADDAQLAREATAAASLLEDHEALEQLVDLLGAEVEAVRTAAHGALRSITGLAYGPDAKRWGTWLEEETQWYEQRAPELFRELENTPARRAIAALGELGGHRYRRSEIALEVQVALSHTSPEVRAAACTTLARLGWRGALPGLVGMLSYEDATVVAAAGGALRSLTGLKHADADLDSWREVLGGPPAEAGLADADL